MRDSSHGFVHIVLLLIATLITVSGIVLYSLRPTDYESCMKFPGSTGLTSIPPTCNSILGSFSLQEKPQTTKANGINKINWKTYRNEDMNFEFSYSGDFDLSLQKADEHTWVNLTNGCTSMFVRKGPNLGSGAKSTSISETTVDGIPATKQEFYYPNSSFPNEIYVDFEIDGEHFTIGAELSGKFVTCNNDNDSNNDIIFDQILSTFEFTDPEIGKVDNSDMSNWDEVLFNGISFSIPPGSKCRKTNEITMSCEINNENENEETKLIYNGVFYVQVEDYKGGSKRDEFKAENGCNPLYIESTYGNVDVLDIPYEAGQCQGIDGATVAIIGNKFVIITNNKYDPDTGQPFVWETRNKIISTLRPEN